MPPIDRLCVWYRTQCNGIWEHSCGVRIDTTDNPGWLVTIDLSHTTLESRAFDAQTRGNPDQDEHWIDCKVQAQQFVGAGGPGDLAELLEIFLAWSERR